MKKTLKQSFEKKLIETRDYLDRIEGEINEIDDENINTNYIFKLIDDARSKIDDLESLNYDYNESLDDLRLSINDIIGM